MKENTISSIEELQGIELGEPCQLFKSNERNRKLCIKVDYFLFGHKLLWATAHFIRFNLHHLYNHHLSFKHQIKKIVVFKYFLEEYMTK